MKVEGKTAIVTGGAQGIGRAFAEALLDKGAKVMLADIKDKQGQDTLKELQGKYGGHSCRFVCVDVTNDEQVTEMFKVTGDQLGSPSIIINNAGILDEHNWRKMININLTANINVLWKGMDVMSKANGKSGGVIVNTASIGAFVPCTHLPVYNGTKAAVMQITRTVGTKLFYEKQGVRVNCFCPSYVETPMTTAESITKCSDYDVEGFLVPATSMMRPADVVSAAMRLVEDEALNGEAMVITKNGATLYEFPNIQL